MTSDKPRSTPTKVCPSCGTRVSERAPRCLVCGHQFDENAKTPIINTPLPGSSSRSNGVGMPQLRLSIPIAVGLLVLFLVVGAGLTYLAINAFGGGVAGAAAEASPSVSPTNTLSPTPETPTATSTPQPTLTPESYTVQSGDDCGGIAGLFDINVQSLVLENPELGADCFLAVNQVLRIPHPTFTPTPAATATLGEQEATIAACETEDYVVQENETMSLIAVTFGVPMEAIMDWNGLTTDTVFLGQHLSIPLCERTFSGGATVTPTLAPPYPPAEALLPADGASFDSSANTVTLQWSSVGTLRGNEYYQVTVTDITGGQNQRIVDEVKDTSFIVPVSFRPTDGKPHIFNWSVVPVAQIGVDAEGLPVYVTGGPASEARVFSWTGSGAPAATPAP